MFPLINSRSNERKFSIISTNEGAISDFVIHDTNGFIVEQENAFELSKAIIKLIKSDDLLSKFKSKSRDLYNKNYNLDIFENKLIKTLTNIMEEN